LTKINLILLFLFTYLFGVKPITLAQNYIWAPDSISLAEPNYAMDKYHDILRYHDPIMYVAFPFIKPLVTRSVPLRDGEGKNGFWVEGQFGYRFVIYQGKYFSYPVFQRTRFTFDVNLMPRMARDNSSPLLPFNNKFGFGLDYLLSRLTDLKKENSTLVWTTLQLHHFSNGQADSFFLNTPEKRNNYRSGDFSTNYFRLMLNVSKTSQQKSIFTTGIGFQREVDLGGPLSSSKELDRYYGVNRALLNFQWTRKPSLITVNYANRGTTENDTVNVSVRRQISFRSELEYILGDLSLFPGTTKYRIGWHNYLTYMPSVNNEVGFMLHTFVGRDYLNIRFDDIVFIGEAGLYVKFNKR
jgi:hypothetical protein